MSGKQSNPGGQSDQANLRTIQTSHSSEMLETLCWDVVPSENAGEQEIEARIISPRIVAEILGRNVPILIDTGSEVTCCYV